ncbi:MAG: amidohydrolase family protein, partial [Myxococcales bacterium]|nr:amidohydrolase family protein [Myxococcales bacterium]
TWVEGPTFQRLAVADLWKPEPEDEDDDEEAEDPLAPDPRVVSLPLEVTLPRARPEGTKVLTNARVLTMNGDEVLDGVNVVIERDRIVEIGEGAMRAGAEIVDCTGKTVLPGLVDTHAHLHFSSVDVFPEQEWRYLVNLDFGVTTVQDPSTFTDLVFTQQERVEAGLELGPRVYSTGYVLYGAQDTAPADTPSLDAARAHVRRQKLVGATSVKVYQQSQRERRQWYVQACREEGVICVPEGGGDTPYDLTMVVDGFHSIEHTIPTTPLFADVRALWAGSTGGEQGDGYGTFYSPVFQVAYGAVMGMRWFEQHGDWAHDERLLRHTPRRLLDAQLWRRDFLLYDEGYRFLGSVRDAAALRDAGVHVTTGSHGELQGMGMHWELWAMGLDGGMSPHEALRAATIEGARYLGLEGEIGTVEVGKLADLIVLDADPIADLHHSTDIWGVLKNGEWVSR